MGFSSPTVPLRSNKKYNCLKKYLKNFLSKKLWGGEFWSDGFFVNTVSKFSSEDTISKYIRNQGIEKEYKKSYYQ